MRVLVAGGGVAGVTAALRASSSGAEVTLLEGSRTVGLSRARLARLLDGTTALGDLVIPEAKQMASMGSVEVRTSERAVAVRESDRVLETSERSLRYDSLVVATGSSAQVAVPRGSAKERSFVMDGPDSYLKLGLSFGSFSLVAVLGPSLLSLPASEVLIERGKKVILFAGRDGWPPKELSPSVGRMVAAAAGRAGLSVIESRIDAIAGMGSVEAVVADGKVHPCDAALTFPSFAPRLPKMACDIGVHGGLLVDSAMSSSDRSVFSAGDCAEVRLGSSSQLYPFDSSARLMGDVAGRNAAGGSSLARLSGTEVQKVFGVEFCLSGITMAEARSAGLDALSVENVVPSRGGRDEPGQLAVSLVFDRGSHEVYGLQIAGDRTFGLAQMTSAVVSMRVRLEELANIESAQLPGLEQVNSPIALTAGLGLGLVRN